LCVALPSGQGDCGVTEGKVVPHLLRIDLAEFHFQNVVTPIPDTLFPRNLAMS